MTGKLNIRIKAFKRHRSYGLHRFVDVPGLHLQILGATVHEGYGRR
jgi:hypothetical protein